MFQRIDFCHLTSETELGIRFQWPSLNESLYFLILTVYKQLLDEVFVISRMIKVEVGVISRSQRLTKTLITLDLIILLFYYTSNEQKLIFSMSSLINKANLEVMFLLLHSWQVTQNARTYDYR